MVLTIVKLVILHALVMQRSYFLYFQLFLQALVFISHFASQAEASNDQRNLADVFRAIPPNVHCEEIIHTNSDGVSIQVCKSGTVRMLPWVTRALRLQRLVSYRRDICSVPIIGSHNSGISMAYVSHWFSHIDSARVWPMVIRDTVLAIIWSADSRMSLESSRQAIK